MIIIRSFFNLQKMRNRALRYLFVFILVFGLLAWLFTNIFFYFVGAIVISAILRPMANYFSQAQIYGLRIPRYFAVILSFLVLSAIISIFVVLFIPVFSAQIEILTGMDYQSIIERISKPVVRLEEFMISNNMTGKSMGFLRADIRSAIIGFVEDRNFVLINNLFSYTGQLLVGIIAVIFIVFFMLYEDGLIRKKLISMIPNYYFEVTISAITKIEILLSNYLVGLLIQMLAIFTLASLGLSLLGIKFALTIALFAAVANLIPYLGPLLGTIFGIIVSLSTSATLLATPNDYLILILKIVLVFGIVQLIDNIVLQPLIFSKSVKAHPLEIFVVIFAGASLAGIPGMIAAIPVYTILRVSVIELYSGYKQYKIFRLT